MKNQIAATDAAWEKEKQRSKIWREGEGPIDQETVLRAMKETDFLSIPEIARRIPGEEEPTGFKTCQVAATIANWINAGCPWLVAVPAGPVPAVLHFKLIDEKAFAKGAWRFHGGPKEIEDLWTDDGPKPGEVEIFNVLLDHSETWMSIEMIADAIPGKESRKGLKAESVAGHLTSILNSSCSEWVWVRFFPGHEIRFKHTKEWVKTIARAACD